MWEVISFTNRSTAVGSSGYSKSEAAAIGFGSSGEDPHDIAADSVGIWSGWISFTRGELLDGFVDDENMIRVMKLEADI